MKRKTLCLPALLLLCISLVSCASPGPADAQGKKLTVVATVFPAYDWAKNVLGENPAGAELSMLVSNGVDLHSYQPSAADILKISSCDLFI